MALLRAQVRFRYYTNLPEDVSTNTFHFVTNDSNPPATDAAAITTALNGFYQDHGVSGASGPYSPVIATSGHTAVFYNLDDPEPRVPIYTGTMTAPPRNSTQNGLPEECAAVLSFQANPQSGVNQARRRGRIYLGPLSQSVNSPGASNAFSAVGTVFRNAVIGAAVEWLLENGVETWKWAVYSPTADTAVLVTNGWMDVSWDTQRRRGGRVTGRQVWPTI